MRIADQDGGVQTEPAGDRGLTIEWPAPGVLRLTLNRPEVLNAVSVAVRDDLLTILRGLMDDPGETRVVILTGTGRAFCSGGDVREFEGFLGPHPTDGYRAQMRFQEMAQLLLQIPCPVVAAINGLCHGGGTAIACMSDIRIASDQASFAVGQVARGLVPDVGLTYLLPRIVGLGNSLELMLSNCPISADEAHRIGLVNRVVPDEQLQHEVLAFASDLATRSSNATEWIKRTTYDNLQLGLEAAFRHEAMSQAILGNSKDFAEGQAAFREKRDGRFT
jgi:2-(1,2-epoxy-1,2-dihydrophenyl)acetyl-CoA isomerase